MINLEKLCQFFKIVHQVKVKVKSDKLLPNWKRDKWTIGEFSQKFIASDIHMITNSYTNNFPYNEKHLNKNIAVTD